MFVLPFPYTKYRLIPQTVLALGVLTCCLSNWRPVPGFRLVGACGRLVGAPASGPRFRAFGWWAPVGAWWAPLLLAPGSGLSAGGRLWALGGRFCCLLACFPNQLSNLAFQISFPN